VIIKALQNLQIFLKYSPRMHIHPSSPNSSLSEDDAAAKIQASFRGYRVRKQLKNSRRVKNEQQQNGHGALNKNSARDQERLEESAVKIQKIWKGFKTRKDLKSASAAATKIQASFRGFKTRRDLMSKHTRKSQ
jgi:myosin heavy subunit